jgi:hypothetical protein
MYREELTTYEKMTICGINDIIVPLERRGKYQVFSEDPGCLCIKGGACFSSPT